MSKKHPIVDYNGKPEELRDGDWTPIVESETVKQDPETGAVYSTITVPDPTWANLQNKPNNGEFIYNQSAAIQAGAQFFIERGKANTFALAPLATAPTAQNGLIYVDSITGKFRVHENNRWEDVITDIYNGTIIYVDKNHPGATDTRGTLSKYSIKYPFKTINAAMAAVTSGDMVWVEGGGNLGGGGELSRYTEEVAYSSLCKTLILNNAHILAPANKHAIAFPSGTLATCSIYGMGLATIESGQSSTYALLAATGGNGNYVHLYNLTLKSTAGARLNMHAAGSFIDFTYRNCEISITGDVNVSGAGSHRGKIRLYNTNLYATGKGFYWYKTENLAGFEMYNSTLNVDGDAVYAHGTQSDANNTFAYKIYNSSLQSRNGAAFVDQTQTAAATECVIENSVVRQKLRSLTGSYNAAATYPASLGTIRLLSSTVYTTGDTLAFALNNALALTKIVYEGTTSNVTLADLSNTNNSGSFRMAGVARVGTSTIAPTDTDNGDLYYNSTEGKLKGRENGAWKSLIPDFVAAKTIYVDYTAPNATNTRTGYSKYDFGRPFATVQAALDAAASGDVIYVKNGSANPTLTFGLTGVTNLTLIAESRSTIWKVVFTQEYTSGIKFYNFDFGGTTATHNLIETSVQQRSYMDFYNCTFQTSGSLYVHTVAGTSGAMMRLYYCTADLKTTTTPLLQHTLATGYSGQLSLYNSYVNAPNANLYGGTGGGRFNAGDLVNSTLNIADLGLAVFYTRTGILSNSIVRCYNGAFFKHNDNNPTSSYYSDIIVRGCQFISTAADTIRINSYGSSGRVAWIENNYFSNLALRVDYGSSNTPQTVHFRENDLGKLTLTYLPEPNITFVNEGNRLIDAPPDAAADANVTVSRNITLLPVITAARTVTLPDVTCKGMIVRLVNQNTAAFAWTTNVAYKKPDGTTTTDLPNGQVVELQSNGTQWVLVNNQAGTSGGGGATPPLQDVLTAGSGLTTAHTIALGSGIYFNIDHDGTGGFYIAADQTAISSTDKTNLQKMAQFRAWSGTGTADIEGTDGTNKHMIQVKPNEILLQALAAALNLKAPGLPSASTGNVLYYDNATGAITYAAAPSGGGGSDTNMANTDLTLDAARSHTFGANEMALNFLDGSGVWFNTVQGSDQAVQTYLRNTDGTKWVDFVMRDGRGAGNSPKIAMAVKDGGAAGTQEVFEVLGTGMRYTRYGQGLHDGVGAYALVTDDQGHIKEQYAPRTKVRENYTNLVASGTTYTVQRDFDIPYNAGARVYWMTVKMSAVMATNDTYVHERRVAFHTSSNGVITILSGSEPLPKAATGDMANCDFDVVANGTGKVAVRTKGNGFSFTWEAIVDIE